MISFRRITLLSARDEGRSLFVGGSHELESLRHLFAQYGEIEQIVVWWWWSMISGISKELYDNGLCSLLTHKQMQGFGFVSYCTKADADRCVREMPNLPEIASTRIRMSIAEPRKQKVRSYIFNNEEVSLNSFAN